MPNQNLRVHIGCAMKKTFLHEAMSSPYRLYGPDTKDYIHKTSFSNENIGFNFLEVWRGLALIPLMQ